MRKIQFAAFGSPITAINSRVTPETSSIDQLNVRVEGGKLRPRFGANNMALPQDGFTAILGFDYLQGFSGTTENEEYVSAETKSGNTRFYSRNVSTLAPTEITNSGSSVNVNASEWVFAVYDDDAYFINPNHTTPVYRHVIGTINSLTAIAIPVAPTVAPTYTVTLGGGSTPYTQLSFAGIDPTVAGEVACTGAATNTGSSLNSDNTLSIRHTNSQVESSFEIDLNDGSAGIQDWTYNDKFAFILYCETGSFDFDPASLKVQLTNNDGSPKVLIPSEINVRTNPVPIGAFNGRSVIVEFSFIDKTRADFDNVRNFKVSYKVTKTSATVANNDLIISKPYIGGIDMTVPPDRTPQPDGLNVGYTYYFSTPQFESGISPLLFIPNSVLQGYSPGAGFSPLGVWLEITMTVSGDANVDNFRIYVGTERFFRVATQADSDATYDLRISYVEAIRLTEYAPSPFTLLNATNACSFKGSMVWFYNTGTDNVRFSRVGDPLRQASAEDAADDDNRGRTMTLADNAADIPLGGVQAADAVMIAGKYGVYVTFGDFPAQMTFIRKVSGSFGVAGKYAFCRWKDDNGMPGMAYVSRDGQIYFAIPGGPSSQEPGDNIILSGPIRDGALSLRTFFIDEQPEFGFTDFSTVQVVSDDQQEALIIAMGRRQLVLRRPDFTGVRGWEPHEWNTGDDTISIRYLSGSTKRRVRGIRSNGCADEYEFDSVTSAYITGTNRDYGNPIETLFWQSKVMVGQNERAEGVRVYRDDLTTTPLITDFTSFTPGGASVEIGSGKIAARLPVAAQGTEHSFRIDLDEDDDPINRIEIWMKSIPTRRLA